MCNRALSIPRIGDHLFFDMAIRVITWERKVGGVCLVRRIGHSSKALNNSNRKLGLTHWNAVWAATLLSSSYFWSRFPTLTSKRADTLLIASLLPQIPSRGSLIALPTSHAHITEHSYLLQDTHTCYITQIHATERTNM